MNDSNTIYIAHSDDSPHEGNNILVPSSADSSALSKKVAQNRAAQRAFRERKKHFVEDLENKAKQLDECKKAMIQLQADNDYLRKSVARLEDQLKQYTVTNSTPLSLTKPFLPPPPPAPSLHPLLPSPFPSMPPQPSPSPSLTKPQITSLSSTKLSSPSSSSSSPPLSFSSSAIPLSSSASHPSSQAKSLSPLSKKEKKRQRLLAEEKLHKNDDLEPIQLHCPYPYQQQQQQTITHNIKNESILSSTIIPTSPGPSVVPNPTRFLQSFTTTTTTATMDDTRDQYIHFVEDTNHPLSQ